MLWFSSGSILKESQLIRDELFFFFLLEIDQICFNQGNSISLFLFLILREHFPLIQVCLNSVIPYGTYISLCDRTTLVTNSRGIPWPEPVYRNLSSELYDF